jgi:hypothetical protein
MKKIFKAVSESLAPSPQCCFCGETIKKEALVAMTLELEEGQLQSMNTHGLCLQKRLHSSVPFIAPEEIQ